MQVFVLGYDATSSAAECEQIGYLYLKLKITYLQDIKGKLKAQYQ